MTLADIHARTVLPLTHIVCGRELLPMTIGHARILDSMNLWGACEPNPLCLAAFVCSRSPDQFKRDINSRWFGLKLWWFKRALGGEWDYAKSEAAWRAYCVYHTNAPAVISTRANGKTQLRMPLVAAMRIYLCEHMGYAPETFDDVLYSQAITDYYGSLEHAGEVRGLGRTVEEMRVPESEVASV